MNGKNVADRPVNGPLPKEIEGFDLLAGLALDMRSSWNHATDVIWRRLDPNLWENTHNPWVVLQTVSRDRIKDMLPKLKAQLHYLDPVLVKGLPKENDYKELDRLTEDIFKANNPAS